MFFVFGGRCVFVIRILGMGGWGVLAGLFSLGCSLGCVGLCGSLGRLGCR